MRYFAALIIIFLFTGMASAYSPGDIEWAPAVSGTLYKGTTLTSGQYMVKAVQFPSAVPGLKDIHGNIVPETDVDPAVFLEIYKNGTLIKQFILNLQTGPFIDPDYEVKVSATGFTAGNAKEWVYEYYNPSATISIQTRGLPKIEVSVATDKATYTSYEDNIITATVTVKNSGTARAKNVDVNLDTGGLKLRGGDSSQLHQYYNNMETGTSQSFSVILLVPQLIDQISYVLSANATGIDVKDLRYKAVTGSITIPVSPKQNYFTISKAVSKDRIYLSETINVRITVANSGMYDIYNLGVNDSMNENFELRSNSSFQWNIPVLKPGQEWGTTYSIKPRETNINGFSLPAASAQFTVNNKPYSSSSKTPSVIVNGPKIILKKTVNKTVVNISEDVTVNLSINNVGNIATKVAVTDSLPDGVSLVNGTISLANISLELNTPVIFNYTIRMKKEGEIVLPPAVANFSDIEYRGTTKASNISNRPVITVIDNSKITPVPTGTALQGNTTAPAIQGKITQGETTSTPIPTDSPEPTPTPITPGFGIGFAIVVLVVMAAIRRR
ncbi:MAG: hypothetical protein O8C67_14120 [Candidatus Methanoperedens sp.]|nr:hypothetical protein [Candidatus Methanoperedens sp.]